MSDNKVTLIGYYGGDYTHANSAWQSTNVELDIELPDDINERGKAIYNETVKHKKKSTKDLLKMLAENLHETPFEKSLLHFQVTSEIASHIHFIKHRIAVSINSESARYKELSDKWYLPDDWENIHVERTFPYSEGADFVDDCSCNVYDWKCILNEYNQLGHQLYHEAMKQLTPTLGRKRAKESARFFLPYAKQLDYDVQFNFRSFIHFQQLRNNEHAQLEIHKIAQLMLDQVRNIKGNPFKHSLEAFGY